ncbi:MAG: hypothetical protein KJ063_01980, partial [Anaerolineae bacterium]|nr:hypothetical protein [Anaerolineae bacterium]
MAYSHAETADLRCPTCGRDFSAPIWLLLDTAHAPDLLTHVREGTLHHTPCPHCQHILELDAPLLLYRPEQTPPLIFSPAQSTSQEQDQEQAAGLLGLLRHQIGDAWQESWLEQAQTIPRPLLPATLSDAPEAALRQFTAQMEQALAELAQQHPELMRELEAAAAQPPPDNPRLTLLQQFIATDTWTASYRFAQEHPELLDQETDTLLAALTQAAQDQGDNDAYGLFNQHLLLLRRAREIGLTAAFAEKIDRTPEELENASQIEQFRAAARDLLAELGVSEGEQIDPEQVARLLAERPDLLARLPVPLADASPGGQLTQQVFDFLFADDDEARQQLQAEAALLTVDAGQMIDQFIAAAHQSGDAAQVAQWQERRQLWQAAYHARLGQPLRPAPAIAEPVQPESWRERPEPQAVQAERATQYTVINPSNSAIGDNARVLNIHTIGDLALRWRRPNQGDPQRAKTALGRETELAELRQRLLAQQNAALVSRGTSAALRGQPAIGKTTLAAMYVARYGPDYSGGVFWLKVGPDNRTAASVRPLLQEMATFAYENNLAAQALLDNTTFAPETVRTLIQGHGPLLVVIDDVWGIEALREIQTALPDDSTILLTTRDYDVAYALENSPAAIQAVDVLSEADARLFLTQKLPHLPEQLADQIAAGLGRHVLALTLAAAALTRHGEAQYDKTAQELLRRVAAGQGFGDLPRLDKAERLTEVEIALKYSYDYLGGGREGGAWQSRFRALGSLAQEADFDTDAAAALWNTSIEAAGQFLLLLQGLSLIEEATSSRWQQHAILRAYALSLQTAEERLDFPERGADHYLTLVQHCYESIPRDHDRVEQEFSHIQHLFDWCEQHSPRRATRFTLWLSDFMRNRGRVPLLNQWLQTALHGAELHGDRLGKANTLTSLGDLESR